MSCDDQRSCFDPFDDSDNFHTWTAPPSLPKRSSLDIWIDSMDTGVGDLERFANGKSQSLKLAPTDALHSQKPLSRSSLTPVMTNQQCGMCGKTRTHFFGYIFCPDTLQLIRDRLVKIVCNVIFQIDGTTLPQAQRDVTVASLIRDRRRRMSCTMQFREVSSCSPFSSSSAGLSTGPQDTTRDLNSPRVLTPLESSEATRESDIDVNSMDPAMSRSKSQILIPANVPPCIPALNHSVIVQPSGSHLRTPLFTLNPAKSSSDDVCDSSQHATSSSDESRPPVSSLTAFDRVYEIDDSDDPETEPDGHATLHRPSDSSSTRATLSHWPPASARFVHDDLEDKEKNGIDDSMNPAKSSHQSISTVQKSLSSLFQKRTLDSTIVTMPLKQFLCMSKLNLVSQYSSQLTRLASPPLARTSLDKSPSLVNPIRWGHR
ncbi:hypothetical protein H0H93_011296 [Arthromyces matolae]|nr:hypothetical protein H0H93_011296 [Arthromyces matolae]